jgi:hypothetical protein
MKNNLGRARRPDPSPPGPAAGPPSPFEPNSQGFCWRAHDGHDRMPPPAFLGVRVVHAKPSSSLRALAATRGRAYPCSTMRHRRCRRPPAKPGVASIQRMGAQPEQTLVESEPFVRDFSPGSTLVPGLKGFCRRGPKCSL